MNKLILKSVLSFIMIGFVTFLTAQVTPNMKDNNLAEKEIDRNPDVKAQKITDRMVETLKLTPEQAEKVLRINQNRVKEGMAARDQQKQDREAVRLKFDNEYKAVLSPEQYKEYTELQETHKANRRKHKGHAMKGEQKHHAKRKKYRDEKIKPFMQNERAEFDQHLDAKDRETLAYLRTQLKIVDRDVEGDQTKLRHRKSLSDKDQKTIDQLIQKYDKQLDASLENVMAEKDKWRAEREAEKNEQRPEKSKAQKETTKHHKSKVDREISPEKKKMIKQRFLLMDQNKK